MFMPVLNILLWSPTYRKEKQNYLFTFDSIAQSHKEKMKIPEFQSTDAALSQNRKQEKNTIGRAKMSAF